MATSITSATQVCNTPVTQTPVPLETTTTQTDLVTPVVTKSLGQLVADLEKSPEAVAALRRFDLVLPSLKQYSAQADAIEQLFSQEFQETLKKFNLSPKTQGTGAQRLEQLATLCKKIASLLQGDLDKEIAQVCKLDQKTAEALSTGSRRLTLEEVEKIKKGFEGLGEKVLVEKLGLESPTPHPILLEIEKTLKMNHRIARTPIENTEEATYETFVSRVEKLFSVLRKDLPEKLAVPVSMRPLLENPELLAKKLDSIYLDGILCILEKLQEKSPTAASLLSEIKKRMGSDSSQAVDATEIVSYAQAQAERVGETCSKELDGKSISFSGGARSSYFADPTFFPRLFVKTFHPTNFRGQHWSKEPCACDVVPGVCDRLRSISWEKQETEPTLGCTTAPCSLFGSKIFSGLIAVEDHLEKEKEFKEKLDSGLSSLEKSLKIIESLAQTPCPYEVDPERKENESQELMSKLGKMKQTIQAIETQVTGDMSKKS